MRFAGRMYFLKTFWPNTKLYKSIIVVIILRGKLFPTLVRIDTIIFQIKPGSQISEADKNSDVEEHEDDEGDQTFNENSDLSHTSYDNVSPVETTQVQVW